MHFLLNFYYKNHMTLKMENRPQKRLLLILLPKDNIINALYLSLKVFSMCVY